MATTAPEERHEEGCFAMTFERKYYHRGGSFFKRSLRPKEYRTGFRGLYVPRLSKERLMNEAESLRYIRQHANIPVPTVYSDFEDDEAYYLVVEYVEGVNMADLSDEQKAVVREELGGYLATLQTLRSNRMGGPSVIVILPDRVMRLTETDSWDFQPSGSEEYVFCHNDLSQHNIIVDPDALRITAIVGWEYAGFYPDRFEMPFCTRVGPSVALEDKGEVDDGAELLAYVESMNKVTA